MSRAHAFDTASRRGLIAAIACISVFSANATLSFPLLSLLLERAGESGARIGVNTAMSSLGMLAFAQVSPALMRRLGVAAFLMGCLAVSAATLLLMKLWPDYLAWLVLRFLHGAAGAGLFLATEFWIVAVSPTAVRGRVVAAYAVALSLGYALGPSILAVVGVDGWPPFLIAVALCAAAAVPLGFAWRDAPLAEGSSGGRPWRFFLSDPAVIWGIVLFGVIEYGAMALTPVWGVRLGMAETAAVVLTVALAFGNLLFQPAVGWAADRHPERPLLLLCAGVCVFVAVLMPAVSHLYAALLPLFFLWGGMAAGLYTIGLTAIGGRYQGGKLAAANAAIVTGYAIGALAGPPVVGGAMDAFGPHGLALVVGLASLIYGSLVIWRLRRS